MHHYRRAQPRLVGEDAPLHAPGYRILHRCAHHAAESRMAGKGALEDDAQGGKNPGGIHDNNHQGSQNIGKGHKGNQFFRHGGNAFQAAHHHQGCQCHQAHAGEPHGNLKYLLHIHGNGVDLAHIANAEGGNHAEAAEQHRQNPADFLIAGVASQAILQIVHSTAAPFTIFVLPAEIDAQYIFGVIGHHAENGNNPHPENRARPASGNGSRHAGDIAGANGGRQGGAEALELADGFILFGSVGGDVLIGKDAADGVLHPVAELGHLKRLGQKGHQDAGAHQHNQHGHTPNETVDSAVYLCDGLNQVFHSTSSLHL